MGHKVKQSSVNSRVDFFYHTFRNILLVSIPLVIISALLLSIPRSSADGVDTLTLTLSSSCTMSSVVDIAHNGSLTSGTYIQNIGQTTIKTLCNDGNGYSVYATGYSNNEEGNNRLINTEYPQYSIDTGLNTSGLTSAWAMKLNNIPDDPSPTPPTIETEYNNTYGIVPPYWTKVASRASGTTDMAQGSSFTTTYAVYASSNQHAGTYVGQVKYMLAHPYSNDKHIYYMQEVDTWKNILALDESIQAVDKRDGKSYWITKLKDGNIWMTQNLDFDIDTTRTYTHNDTDLGWDPYNFDTNATWTPDTTNGKYNLPVTGTSVPGWSNQNNYPYSADPGDVYYYTSNSEADDIKYTSLSNCVSAGHTEGECKHYHAGNYYNWTAAIASNNSTNISTDGAIAPNSICPKGWRLPYTDIVDNSHNEFGRLLYDYNITNNIAGSGDVGYKVGGFNTIRVSPLWFVRSGAVHDYTLTSSGFWGSYWSSIVEDGFRAYDLVFNASRILLNFDYNRYYGWSIRCLAR